MSTIELNPTQSPDFVLTETDENNVESKDPSQKVSTPCLREASKAHLFTTKWLCGLPHLGLLGAHQFYAGKPLKGLAMALLTLSGFCNSMFFIGNPLGLLITLPWLIKNMFELHTECFKDGKGKFILPLPTRVIIIDQR